MPSIIPCFHISFNHISIAPGKIQPLITIPRNSMRYHTIPYNTKKNWQIYNENNIFFRKKFIFFCYKMFLHNAGSFFFGASFFLMKNAVTSSTVIWCSTTLENLFSTVRICCFPVWFDNFFLITWFLQMFQIIMFLSLE